MMVQPECVCNAVPADSIRMGYPEPSSQLQVTNSRNRTSMSSTASRTLAPPHPLTYLALATTLVLWASGFAGNRAALPAYQPGHLVLLRGLIASGCFLLAAPWLRLRPPAWRDLPGIAGLGFLGITLYHAGIGFGQRTVGAGATSLIIATEGILVPLLAIGFLGERLTRWAWLATAVCVAGVYLIVVGESESLGFSLDALWICGACVATSAYFVFQKPYLRRYRAVDFIAFAVWSGTAFLLVFLPGLGEAVVGAPWEATMAVVYLGIFPSALAYATWTFALSQLPASLAGNALYGIPPLAIVIAFVWLGELPAPLTLVGGVLTLGGVVLFNRLGVERT